MSDYEAVWDIAKFTVDFSLSVNSGWRGKYAIITPDVEVHLPQITFQFQIYENWRNHHVCVWNCYRRCLVINLMSCVWVLKWNKWFGEGLENIKDDQVTLSQQQSNTVIIYKINLINDRWLNIWLTSNIIQNDKEECITEFSSSTECAQSVPKWFPKPCQEQKDTRKHIWTNSIELLIVKSDLLWKINTFDKTWINQYDMEMETID